MPEHTVPQTNYIERAKFGQEQHHLVKPSALARNMYAISLPCMWSRVPTFVLHWSGTSEACTLSVKQFLYLHPDCITRHQLNLAGAVPLKVRQPCLV